MAGYRVNFTLLNTAELLNWQPRNHKGARLKNTLDQQTVPILTYMGVRKVLASTIDGNTIGKNFFP
jgi:hypothetical protein